MALRADRASPTIGPCPRTAASRRRGAGHACTIAAHRAGRRGGLRGRFARGAHAGRRCRDLRVARAHRARARLPRGRCLVHRQSRLLLAGGGPRDRLRGPGLPVAHDERQPEVQRPDLDAVSDLRRARPGHLVLAGSCGRPPLRARPVVGHAPVCEAAEVPRNAVDHLAGGGHGLHLPGRPGPAALVAGPGSVPLPGPDQRGRLVQGPGARAPRRPPGDGGHACACRGHRCDAVHAVCALWTGTRSR